MCDYVRVALIPLGFDVEYQYGFLLENEDILKHLNSNSDGVRERLGKGSFIKDDGKIDARETFLLTWVEEVWEGENGNQALHDQLLSFMNGTPQEFSTYERDLP